MVDSTEATESDFVSVDMVKGLEKPQLVILGGGDYEEGDYGRKLVLPVNIDGREKKWSVNKDSAKNLKQAFGADTVSWVGYIIKLNIIRARGKDCIIALPTNERDVRERDQAPK